MNSQIHTIQRSIQSFIRKYDVHFTTVVARIPNSLQTYSATLGHATLPMIWAAILAVTCLVSFHAGNTELAVIGLIILACIPFGTVLKLLVRRSRPKTLYAQNMKVKSYSFPSSHAYSATLGVGYFALLSLTLLTSPISYIAAFLCLCMIVVIGISRIHIGAHYPTDVTAGWTLGAIVLYSTMHLIS